MKHADKVIVTSAITGAIHSPCMSPYLPITPDEIVRESVAAAEAGASIVHLHARDPEDGFPSTDPEVYRQFLPRIKQQSDVVINITTGQPSRKAMQARDPELAFEERLLAPKEFSPEICSFNLGPLNPGVWAFKERFEGKFKYEWERQMMTVTKGMTITNTFAQMERVAKELGDERGVKFEFECFDIGHLYTLRFIMDQGWLKPPFFIQSIFGFLGGLGHDPKHLLHMKQTADDLFGDDYYWSVLATGRHQMRLVAMSAIMGGNVRVGMEDSLWYGKGEMAKSNADQVKRICRILEELSLEVATPDEARAILGTKGADKVNF